MALTIGSVRISRERPAVAVTVTDIGCLAAAAEAVDAGADLIEARVDRFAGLDSAEGEQAAINRVAELRASIDAPLLVTVRGQAENGGYQRDESARAELYFSLLNDAQAIDIELRASHARDEVVPVAQRLGVAVIVSMHDFESAPDDATLERALDDGFAAGASMVKLAVTPRDRADVVRLLALTERNAERDIIVIAMGSVGRVSRLMFPYFGSRMTYAHAGQAAAPGQIGVADTRYVLNLIH